MMDGKVHLYAVEFNINLTIPCRHTIYKHNVLHFKSVVTNEHREKTPCIKYNYGGNKRPHTIVWDLFKYLLVFRARGNFNICTR